jgi:hypothetical protein
MIRIGKYITVPVAILACGAMMQPFGMAQAGTFRIRDGRMSLAAMLAWSPGSPSPTVSVIPAATNVTAQQSFAVTVEVSAEPGAPAPTGTVVLHAGSFQASSALGVGGEAAVTVPGGMLATGTNVLIASYTPDAASAVYYAAGTGQSVVEVYPEPAYFSLAAQGITVARGETVGNQVAVRVQPYRGFTGLVLLTAAVTRAPKVVHDFPLLSFGSTNPVRILDGSAGSAILTITTSGSGGWLAKRDGERFGGSIAGWMLLGLAILTWPTRRTGWMQRRAVQTARLLIVGMFSLLLMGCGIQAQSSLGGGTTPGDYTVTVTGAGAGVSSTAEFTITVH